MITVFFNGIAQYVLNMLQGCATMDSTDFSEGIIGGLKAFCYPERRIPHERRIPLHFNNTPVDNSKSVKEKMIVSGVTRMRHPPSSSDLAPCDIETVLILMATTSSQDSLFQTVLSDSFPCGSTKLSSGTHEDRKIRSKFSGDDNHDEISPTGKFTSNQLGAGPSEIVRPLDIHFVNPFNCRLEKILSN
jgi:hypothetical protein